ncbi:AAA domain-containing protein [Gordonia malaquae]|uniref:Nuclease SbcCD subunit C n=1 Tax=Gordonia malaquae NBRC 108250 TaxID=1223542 RepID=M3TIG8_GORML|nr:AAA family ATPase [Gordonia malaquae]GAC81296.1 hypothetical protein GM1_031_00490 [Gordonia malaquae NBRC 108250]SEC16636.1 AAA domain-containing protein [Gordonia malaquae]
MSSDATLTSTATVDEVWDLIEQTSTPDEVAFTVLAAMSSDVDLRAQIGGAASRERPAKVADQRPDAALAYVRAITVEGFRGVGPRASLVLEPRPGLTVVSGRNGSGKSSFAEAFEYAVTGRSYRWENKKSKVWQDAWRNLHHGSPCRIGVEVVQQPDGAGGDAQRVLIAARWDEGGGLDDATTWVRIAGGENQPVSSLGWDRPAELYRPILSYDEIGGLFEERQSALYDALNKILGLDEITDATARISSVIKEIGDERKRANGLRLALRKVLATADDPRAGTVNKALASRPYKLDVVEKEIAGAESPQQRLIQELKACADSVLVDQAAVDAAVGGYRSALERKLGAAETALELLSTRTTLLRDAQRYVTEAEAADCPVCETPLSAEWQQRVAATIEDSSRAVEEHADIIDGWKAASRQVSELVADLPDVSLDGSGLDEVDAYRAAVARLRELPEQSAVAEHVSAEWPRVVAAHEALTVAAARRADELTDAWAPLVEEIVTWLSAEKTARENDAALDNLNDAKKWLNDHGSQLRDQRMQPIVDSARDIWSRLKQESDVDLGAIELLGTGTQRRVALTGSVDGEDTGVLSVMSQGELHALALALFIPRATVGDSPFGFLFLDDPIQAMDPAKIDGFLAVLQELAKTRQVVVFSHDDRLPTAIRRLSVDATLLEVSREPGSKISVKRAEVTADRYAADAYSLIRDEGVPAHVKNAAGPGLFRLAVESAAKQRYFHECTRAGIAYAKAEEDWAKLIGTKACVAVSLGRDPKESLGGWQSPHSHPHRNNVMGICTVGVHEGGVLGLDDVRDLRKTLRDLLGSK